MATTHYSEIKAFALSRDRMQNASMEFDVDRLCPTYRLYIGIPGKSNAFEISRRLGLSSEVIDRARQFLKKEDVAFEDVLSGAEEQRRIAEKARHDAQLALWEAEKLRNDYEKEKRKLDEELMTYFPELFASSVEKNQTDLLYRRALLQLAEITDGVDNTEAIRAIDGQIYAMADTPNFEGNASAEIEIDKRFEEMCLVIAKEFGGKVKGYSVMEFYTANKILADRQKQLNKTRKK
jgi:hypothetical protein